MNKEKIKEVLSESGVDIIKILEFFKCDSEYKNDNTKMVLCAFHEEKTESMQINDDETVHCYSCGIHLDIVQLYAALKSGDIDNGKFIYDTGDISETINSMIKDFNLDLNIDALSGYIINEKKEYLIQLKEKKLGSIFDSMYVKNSAMDGIQYSPVILGAGDIYLYKDPYTKESLMIKVRYETYIGKEYEQILYSRNENDYIEYMIGIPENPIKRKSFRFYDIVAGKVVKGALPEEKKNIIYNGEKVLDIVNDDFKRNRTWIWFVEGEKDVDSLMDYGFNACSLMKGSGSKWIKKYNDIFRGCNVIIASDFDDAGEKYEETLFKAFFYGRYIEKEKGEDIERNCTIGLKKMNEKFYEINKMPVKSDITDLIEKWKLDGLTKADIIIKLNEIIERSIDYKSTDSVIERDYGLYNGGKKIADFIVEDAVNIISTDNTQSDMIQLTIKGEGGVCKKFHTRIACIQDIFGNVDAFNKTYAVMDATFLGNRSELFKLKKFILNYKIFHRRYMYPSNGMYKHEGEWVTVTPDGALRSNGMWDHDVFSSNSILYNDLISVDIPSKDKINEVAIALLNFNTPEIVYNVLGEVGCKLLNGRYRKLNIKNHLLALNGTKGAGKTETTVKIMAAITNDSSRGEYNVTGQTNFTFLKNVSSNNIGGMILQELKLGRMADYEKNKWSEIFRNNYDRAKSQRGTKDQQMNQYDQSNPIITTGEEGIGEESALYERFNLIFMTADKRLQNPKYSDNFRILCDNQDTLHGIGKQLIIDIMNLEDNDIKSARKSIELKIRDKALDKRGFIDRVLNNAINVIHGFAILSNTLVKLGYDGKINVEKAFNAIINNFLENVLRINDSNANDDYEQMLVQYQKALENDYKDKVVAEASNAYHVHDKCLWISPTKLRTVVVNYVQDSKISITILSENEFRKNLAKAGYISEDKSNKKKFNQEKAKGWYYKVDITRIKKLELGFIDELILGNEVIDPDEFLNPRESPDVIKPKEEVKLY